MLIKTKQFFSNCWLLFKGLLKIAIKPDVTGIIGLSMTILIFILNYPQHGFYPSIRKEQSDSDLKLFEIVGNLISQDNRLSKESINLKIQFNAIYYGKMNYFESCFGKDTKRVEYIRDFKKAIDNYYGKNETWGVTLDDIKFKANKLSEELSNSYKEAKENEC